MNDKKNYQIFLPAAPISPEGSSMLDQIDAFSPIYNNKLTFSINGRLPSQNDRGDDRPRQIVFQINANSDFSPTS